MWWLEWRSNSKDHLAAVSSENGGGAPRACTYAHSSMGACTPSLRDPMAARLHTVRATTWKRSEGRPNAQALSRRERPGADLARVPKQQRHHGRARTVQRTLWLVWRRFARQRDFARPQPGPGGRHRCRRGRRRQFGGMRRRAPALVSEAAGCGSPPRRLRTFAASAAGAVKRWRNLRACAGGERKGGARSAETSQQRCPGRASKATRPAAEHARGSSSRRLVAGSRQRHICRAGQAEEGKCRLPKDTRVYTHVWWGTCRKHVSVMSMMGHA